MNTKFYNSNTFSISEYADLLFCATDENNILKIPHYEENNLSVRPQHTEIFKMKWGKKDLPKAISLCELITKSVKEIAEIKTKNEDDFIEVLRKDDNNYFIYKKYIESLDEEPVDYNKFEDIIERKDGGDLTDEEWRYYDKVITARMQNAQLRVGGKAYAYEFVIAAQRLYNLYLLNAPEKVINNEIAKLTEAIILNNYAIEIL